MMMALHFAALVSSKALLPRGQTFVWPLRLRYFDARGRGELTRLLRLMLAYGKLEYEVNATSHFTANVSEKDRLSLVDTHTHHTNQIALIYK